MEIGRIKIAKSDITITSNQIGLAKSELPFWNNFSKLAVLTIIGGYLKSDYIVVNDLFPKGINFSRLNSFLSYTLNHHISPKKFNLKISQTAVANSNSSVNNKRLAKINAVLAFSGGLDSTAGLLYALDRKQVVLPLWINFGQRNHRAERTSVLKILSKLKIKPVIIKLNLSRYILEGWKEWSFIVPGRNFLFLSLANSLLSFSAASKKFIYLCAHKDEMKYSKNRDKSRYFFNRSSHFFSVSTGREVIATSPFTKYSKAEVLSYWRRKWEKKYKVSPLETSTCYYSTRCGHCEACLKRSVQLLAAGYPAQQVLDYPFSDPDKIIKKQWLPRIKKGLMPKNNKLDFIIALENNLTKAAPYVKDFYVGLSANTLRAARRRQKEIENCKII